MMVGAVTLLTVTALPVASALAPLIQLAAPARLKVVASTAVVPVLFSSPLTLILSVASSVTENAVVLLAVTV